MSPVMVDLIRGMEAAGMVERAAALRAMAEPPVGMVTLVLNGELSRWCVGVTSAPVNYDGFGTFTLCNHSEGRLVAVEEGSLQWQRTRYGSGLFGYRPATTEETATANEVIMRRITGVNPVE